MPREQNAGQYYKNVRNKSLKSKANFQYLRMSPRKNRMREEIRSGDTTGNPS
jgi:hypothetical protein